MLALTASMGGVSALAQIARNSELIFICYPPHSSSLVYVLLAKLMTHMRLTHSQYDTGQISDILLMDDFLLRFGSCHGSSSSDCSFSRVREGLIVLYGACRSRRNSACYFGAGIAIGDFRACYGMPVRDTFLLTNDSARTYVCACVSRRHACGARRYKKHR